MSRAFGISVSSSLVKFVPTCVVEVSTTGEAPVTVTVSCSVATLQLLVDGQRLVDDDAHAFALDVLEAGELERHLVDARRQRDEAVVAVGAGHLHLRLDQRRAAWR